MKSILKELPEQDRPREKLLAQGPQALSITELLAIILGSGHQEENAIELSRRILRELSTGEENSVHGQLRGIAKARKQQLLHIKGVGPAKAASVLASVELGRRLMSPSFGERMKICCAEDAAQVLMVRMQDCDVEEFAILGLSTKKTLLGMRTISRGCMTSTFAEPREVFSAAMQMRAHTIILAHNHPSGDAMPSGADRDVTKRLCKAGKLLGIRVEDHLIIGHGTYYSFRRQGEMTGWDD